MSESESQPDIVADVEAELGSLKEADPESYAKEVGYELSLAIGRLGVPDKRQQMQGQRLISALTPHLAEIANDDKLSLTFTRAFTEQMEQRERFMNE